MSSYWHDTLFIYLNHLWPPIRKDGAHVCAFLIATGVVEQPISKRYTAFDKCSIKSTNCFEIRACAEFPCCCGWFKPLVVTSCTRRRLTWLISDGLHVNKWGLWANVHARFMLRLPAAPSLICAIMQSVCKVVQAVRTCTCPGLNKWAAQWRARPTHTCI